MCHRDSQFRVNQVCVCGGTVKETWKKELFYSKLFCQIVWFELIWSFFVCRTLILWFRFIPREQINYTHTAFHSFPVRLRRCSFMWQQLLFCLCVYVCAMRCHASGCRVCVRDFRGRGRWEGQVRRERPVLPHVAFLDQPLPVYCCSEVLCHEDNRAVTSDSDGTEAHPAADAILFGISSHLVTWPAWPATDSHVYSLYVILVHSAVFWLNGCFSFIL